MSKYGHNKNTKKKQGWNVRDSVTRPELGDPRSRVDLDPMAFDRLIQQKGVKVKVYRSMFCPKVKSVDSAEHEIDCDLCNGSGFVDYDPLCTTGVIQNQEFILNAMVEGNVDANSVAITFPIGIELQYFTKIELEDFTEIYFQRVLRNPDSDTDVLKYSACRVNVLIDYDGVRYYQDQDFKIDQSGNIKWTNPLRTPSDNKVYSIHYESKVQFRATRAMHVNRFSQVKGSEGIEFLKFQEQWLCTKEYLVKRTDQNGNELFQGPFDNHTIVSDD